MMFMQNKKPLLIGISIAVIALGIGGVFLSKNNNNTKNINENSKNENEIVNSQENAISAHIAEVLTMAELWPPYHNDENAFGFKYPKDLTTRTSKEDVFFESGKDIVFSLSIIESINIDNDLAARIANQCSKTTQYSDVDYNTYTYRKALDVPDENCLKTLGVVRNNEVASFGRKLANGKYLIVTNSALNAGELEAVMWTLYDD